MEQENEKIGIVEGDFITPKKAITITTISMVIWFITGGSYALLKLFISGIDYLTYTFVASFILSILFSIYVVSKLVRKTDLVMKIIIGVLNAALIYTSVNGVQATYGFLNQNQKDSSPPKTKDMGFLIPFLDPRPWIPDKILMAENDKLANENKKLLSENEELTRQNGLLQTTINSMRDSNRGNPDKILRENSLLHDSVSILVNNLEGCQKQNSQLSRQLESLRGRIQQFNARQSQWRQKTAARVSTTPDPSISRILEITGTVKKNVNSLMNDNSYYDFLFLTPINGK